MLCANEEFAPSITGTAQTVNPTNPLLMRTESFHQGGMG